MVVHTLFPVSNWPLTVRPTVVLFVKRSGFDVNDVDDITLEPDSPLSVYSIYSVMLTFLPFKDGSV